MKNWHPVCPLPARQSLIRRATHESSLGVQCGWSLGMDGTGMTVTMMVIRMTEEGFMDPLPLFTKPMVGGLVDAAKDHDIKTREEYL